MDTASAGHQTDVGFEGEQLGWFRPSAQRVDASFAVALGSGRSILVIFFRLRFGNCDASRRLTLVPCVIL